MKFAAYGILASTSSMSVNDLLGGPLAIQYGALAILGGILCYLLGWTLPTIISAQAAQRTDFLASQSEDRKAALATTEATLAAAEATRHDFRDSLTGISRSVDCMAVAISEVRRRGS